MSFINGNTMENGVASAIPHDSAAMIKHAEDSFINPMLLSWNPTSLPTASLPLSSEIPNTMISKKNRADIDIDMFLPAEDGNDTDVAQPSQDIIVVRKLTGCSYDERMAMHACTDSEAVHPERPDRIRAIMRGFRQAGIVFAGLNGQIQRRVSNGLPLKYIQRIAVRPARKDEVCIVHAASVWQWVFDLQHMTLIELRDLSEETEYSGRKSLYVNAMTTQAAILSAGAAIDTCKHVVSGSVKNAIAVIRPPGHHAECKDSMGFCFFNNVAIAASVCLADYPDTCRKILILDWDVHHGNGTQNIFYSNPAVMYISLHVFQNGSFYPGNDPDPSIPNGDLYNVGLNAGLGYNVNIPWHDQGMGDAEYMSAFERVVMPISREFNPDLVIISAGFDAAAGDPLGECYVSPACYSQMTYMLMGLAGGKVSVCLEGGYDLDALSCSALAVTRTLMGEPPIPIQDVGAVHPEAEVILTRVIEQQSPYWDCFRHVRDATYLPSNSSIDMSSMVRYNQARYLMERHAMVNMYMHNSDLYHPMQKQILATPGIDIATKIILILHDPPDIVAYPDVNTRKIEPHNATIVDGVRAYVDWAVAKGYGVMDINVPFDKRSTTHDQTFNLLPDTGVSNTPDEELMLPRLQELMDFVWDNYFDLWSTKHIILMGVGHSYFGVKLLLTSRDTARTKISGVLNFVTGSLRPIRSPTDPTLSKWYKANSQVYVDAEHACWDGGDVEARVGKKRFGDVIKSGAHELNGMLECHFDQATAWIEDRCADVESGVSEGEEWNAEA